MPHRHRLKNKLHRAIGEVFAHHGYCDADKAARDFRYGVRWDAGLPIFTFLGINLLHAPVVRIRYVGIDPADADTTRSIDQAEVGGSLKVKWLSPDSCAAGHGHIVSGVVSFNHARNVDMEIAKQWLLSLLFYWKRWNEVF